MCVCLVLFIMLHHYNDLANIFKAWFLGINLLNQAQLLWPECEWFLKLPLSGMWYACVCACVCVHACVCVCVYVCVQAPEGINN